MRAVEKLVEDFNGLDEFAQQELIDFLEFIKQKENKIIEKVADKIFDEYDEVFRSLAKSYYSRVNDVVTHCSEVVTLNHMDNVIVYFNREEDCEAQILLPAHTWLKIKGFTNAEVRQLKRYAKNNDHLIWDLARGH